MKSFYFAHNFEDRIEFREIELQLEKELDIQLFNPFYDDLERIEEMKILDAVVMGTTERLQQLKNQHIKREGKCLDIVRRDLKNLATQDGLLTIVKTPSFGTAIEICNAKLMCLPIIFISEKYADHPWIQIYANHVFYTIQEFREWFEKSKRV